MIKCIGVKMKNKKVGIKSKHLLVIVFSMLLFFVHYVNGQTTTNSTDKKIVDCEYSSVIEIWGNDDCKLFCLDVESKCTYDNGEKKTESMICPTIKNAKGSWVCPKAYDCLIAETPEYDEQIKNDEVMMFNPDCEGVVLNNNSKKLLELE